MVNFELRRDRIVARFRDKKTEWVIEPRYWRNPIIGISVLLILPLFRSVLSAHPDHVHDGQSLCGYRYSPGAPDAGNGPGQFRSAALPGNRRIHGRPPESPFRLESRHDACGNHYRLRASSRLLLSPTTLIAKGLYFSLITLILPLTFLDVTYIWGDIFRGRSGSRGHEPAFVIREGFLELYCLLLSFPVSDAVLSPLL